MRRFVITTTLFLLCLLWLGSGADTLAEGRKLTIMVYMCGSNLESEGGSAMEDIQEMLAAFPEGQETALLVMTGGSNVEAQSSYFQTDNAGVYEIASGGRIRKLKDSPSSSNMGDGGTLAAFLRFCQDQRPADHYALILWNHGGGPLEGVCWDETGDPDHLTMEELTNALRESLTGKLEWIGFDACLMGSLEVAGVLIPYANYMIASQEMEPSFGWNYGFLKELDPAAGGAQAGRQIVDAYFSGRENSSEILTLACIDLGKVDDVIAALDPVFLPLSRTLDNERYQAVSARRMKTIGFGKAQPDDLSSGYDLVDVRDMVESLEPTEDTGLLLEKLDGAVVYNRANEDGANGLTVYYPFENKTRFTTEWRERYAAYSFSAGYQAYVEAFGRILTGEELMAWMNLVPSAGLPDEAGYYPFEMHLTEEQARNVVSAQVMIIGDTVTSRLGDNCVLLATCGAELGEDNVLRGKWDGRCLYVETEQETVGPVSFRQTDDEKKKLVTAYYVQEGSSDLQGKVVQFELDAGDQAEYPEISRIIAWDDVTESFSSRNQFSEDGYDQVIFWNIRKSIPDIGEDLVLPPMNQWAEESKEISFPRIILPKSWKLHMISQNSGRQLYAMFRLVDSQHQVVCSIPVAVPNPYRTVFTPVTDAAVTDDLQAELACALDTSPDRKGFHLEWAFHNSGERKIKIGIRNPVINDTRLIGSSYVAAYGNNTSFHDMHLSFYDIAGLDHLESVSGVLELTTEEEETRYVPFRFSFSGEDLTDAETPEPLAQAGQDGVAMTLLGIEPGSFSRLNTYVLVDNNSGEELATRSVSINELTLSAFSDPIPPGLSRVAVLEADNECASVSLKIREDEPYQVTYIEYYLLQAMGNRDIREVTIEASVGEDIRLFSMPLHDPLPLTDPVPVVNKGITYPVWNPPDDLPLPQQDRLPVLAENDDVRIRLRRMVTGLNGIAMSIEIENRSDHRIRMDAGNCAINGQQAAASITGSDISPHKTRVKDMEIVGFTLPEGEDTIREIALSFYDAEYLSSSDAVSATIIPEKPIHLEENGGIWMNGERFTTVPARLPDKPEEKESVEADSAFLIARDLAVPESAGSYSNALDSGLLPVETAGATECKAAVIRKTDEGWLQILTIQDLEPDEEGRLVLRHPGLILTVEEDPSIGVMTSFFTGTDGTLNGNARLGASVMTESWETVTLKNIRWSLNLNTNTGEVDSFEQDIVPSEPVSLLSTSFLTCEIRPETNAEGFLPHISDIPTRNDFDWFLNTPEVTASHPVRLMLRPVTPEDELYVLFSIALEDGTRRSLPPVPYPDFVSDRKTIDSSQ